MLFYIKKRILEEGRYIAETGSTVRDTAKKFSLSKSTVHKDVSEKLIKLDKKLYKRVREVLDKNLSERHIRGGEATRIKYTKKNIDNSKYLL